MFKISSLLKKYPVFRQFSAVSLVLFSGLSYGQVSPEGTLSIAREPASYIPDDDVIVKPVDNELSFYQQYVASDNSKDVVRSRNQLKVWNDNQQFADQYGLDSTLAGSPYFVPTPEEKFKYFQKRYMRYLKRKGEEPLKDAPKEWYQDITASNEVDTIDEMEEHFKKTSRKGRSNKALPGALQKREVSIWKKTKFIFQPRLDQGLIIVGIKGPIEARAWVGINGETEVNVQKKIKSIGFRIMVNYYAHTGRYFTSADQRIMDNLYARVTSQADPEATDIRKRQDNTLMLLYAKQF